MPDGRATSNHVAPWWLPRPAPLVIGSATAYWFGWVSADTALIMAVVGAVVGQVSLHLWNRRAA